MTRRLPGEKPSPAIRCRGLRLFGPDVRIKIIQQKRQARAEKKPRRKRDEEDRRAFGRRWRHGDHGRGDDAGDKALAAVPTDAFAGPQEAIIDGAARIDLALEITQFERALAALLKFATHIVEAAGGLRLGSAGDLKIPACHFRQPAKFVRDEPLVVARLILHFEQGRMQIAERRAQGRILSRDFRALRPQAIKCRRLECIRQPFDAAS